MAFGTYDEFNERVSKIHRFETCIGNCTSLTPFVFWSLGDEEFRSYISLKTNNDNIYKNQLPGT